MPCDPPAPGLRADLESACGRPRKGSRSRSLALLLSAAIFSVSSCSVAGLLAAAVLHAHVHGRLRLLLLAAELPAAGDATAADRPVRRDPGPAGAGGDRRRGCPGAGRPDGGGGGCPLLGLPAPVVWLAMGLAGALGGASASAGRRPAPLSRRQRDDLQPADRLHRDRNHEPAGRGPPARSGQPEQALHPADRRRLHAAGHAGPRRALGPGRRRRRLHRRLAADGPHHLRLCRPHHRRQLRAPPCCRACRSAS